MHGMCCTVCLNFIRTIIMETTIPHMKIHWCMPCMCRYVFEDACVTDGDLYENDNHTANTACCDCGGGIVFDFRNPSPSSAPSLAPTKSPTVLESHHPSISPVPSQTPTESHQPSHSVSPSQPPTESHQPSISSQPTSYVCEDNHENCQFWAEQGECDTNPSYMHYNCRLACDKCD